MREPRARPCHCGQGGSSPKTGVRLRVEFYQFDVGVQFSNVTDDGERKTFRKKLIFTIIDRAFPSLNECVYGDYGQGSLSYYG